MSLKERVFVNPFKVTKHGEDEQEIDENAIDPSSPALRQPPATRAELWSYYLYYNGDNGFTMFSYIPNILQYLAYKGGFYPNTPDVKGCDINDALTPCYISWNNGSLPVSSMVLYVQAISFSLQFLLFTTFGGLADYGRWNRWILLLATIIGCASQIVPIALVNDDGSHWGAMMAINIIALIAYGTSLVFYAAAFPTLSDNLPAVRYARASPRLNEDQKQVEVEKWRNHVSAISTSFSNVGFFVITAVLFGASYAPWPYYDFPEGTEPILGNAPIYNFIATVVCGGYWLLFALPYFVFVPRGRTGPPLPEGINHLTVGWKSIFKALKEIRKLRYLFIYILSYFMFSDAVNTTNQMISIVQGQITSFSAMQVTMLNFASSITSIIGCLFFLWISKQFGIKTKHNLLIIITLSTVVPIWGCFGIGLDNFGIKTEWELWAFYVWSGLFTAPIWAWQQTMLAELTPKGQENLVFGLFGVINKASSWIGPVVIGAITEHTSNLWHGWPFIAALFVIAIFMIVFLVDVDKAKVEHAVYEAELARRRGLDPESHEKCELPEAAQVEEAKTP